MRPRYKATNWKQYNKALINRGSDIFWIEEEVISEQKQGHPRNLAVGRLQQERFGYQSETAMYRLKQLLDGKLV